MVVCNKTRYISNYREGQILEPRVKSSAKDNEKIIRMGRRPSPHPPMVIMVLIGWLWP